MENFKTNLKLYFKSPLLSILTGLLFLLIGAALPTYYFLFRSDATALPLFFLLIVLLISTFLPVFFMFISYEYFYKIKKSNLQECIKGIQNGLLKSYASQLGVLILISFLLFCLVICSNILIYFDMHIQSTEYLFHIIENVFLNVFLVSLVGIFLGLTAALVLKRIPAYLLLITFALIGSGVFYTFFFGLYYNTGFNAYPFLDLFSITSPSLSWTPNTQFGFSLLSYQYQRLGIWIFGALSIFFYYVTTPKKTSLRAVAAVCLAACIGCTVLFYLPASKVNMEVLRPNSSAGDRYYVQKNNPLIKEEDGGFQITSYDLDFQIGRQLKAKATLTVDQPKLNTYKLTLYHGYRVKSAANQDGVSLSYTQEGDYVTVNRGSEAVEQITLTYAGSHPQYYANRQGVFLPGQFSYYPHSGYQKIMDDTGVAFQKNALSPTTKFHVTTDSNKKIYSNLKEQPDGSLTGEADSLTLMSGFLKELRINGITVVYPYLDRLECTPQLLETEVRALIEQKKDNIQYKKIFLMPNVNQEEKIVVFHDYLNAAYLFEILPEYEKNFILQYKHTFYDLLFDYQHNPDRYQGELQFELDKIKSGNQNTEKNPVLLFDQTVKAIGEEAMLPACQAYLQDNHDTRTVIEFLQSLQEKENQL